MKLPFLNEKDQWPTAKEPEERVGNPSHDTKLQDHLIDELLVSMEGMDPGHKREALLALVHSILNEEHDEM